MNGKNLDASAPGWDDVSRWVLVLPAGDRSQVFGTYPSKADAFQAAYEYGITNFVPVQVEDIDTAFGEVAA